MLTADQLQAYDRDGYLHLPAAFGADVVDMLLGELNRIIDGECGDVHGDDFIRPEESTEDRLKRCVAVHFPHKLSEPVRDFVRHPVFASVLTALLGPNIKCVQTMFFVRPAGGPGQAWHQDEYYIPSRDRSVTASWVSLDRATRDNGCLWVFPGSHRAGMIWPHVPHDDPRFDPVGQAAHLPYDEADAVALETEPGDLLVFNGYLLHRSLNNQAASGFRRSLGLHSARAETLLPWMGAEQEAEIGGADCRDFEMVAGADPYPWKERTDVLVPWLRPARQD